MVLFLLPDTFFMEILRVPSGVVSSPYARQVNMDNIVGQLDRLLAIRNVYSL